MGDTRSGTILEEDICRIPAHGCMYLRAETACLGQTPLATRRPTTIIGHCRVNGLTHYRVSFESRLEGPGESVWIN